MSGGTRVSSSQWRRPVRSVLAARADAQLIVYVLDLAICRADGLSAVVYKNRETKLGYIAVANVADDVLQSMLRRIPKDFPRSSIRRRCCCSAPYTQFVARAFKRRNATESDRRAVTFQTPTDRPCPQTHPHVSITSVTVFVFACVVVGPHRWRPD